MPKVNPYLVFDGDCEEAFNFYRSVFGGEFSDVNRFSDAPGGAAVDEADMIMHISLPIGPDQVLMGSDRPPRMGKGTVGDQVSLSVEVESGDEGRRIFEQLSAEGSVSMPYEKQFWGADFGMCTDRFGVNWMISFIPAG